MLLGHQAQLLLLLRMGTLGTALRAAPLNKREPAWTSRHENNSLRA
jgi:hypothetical protein